MTIDIKVPTPTQAIVNLSSKKQEELQKVSIQIATGNKHEDFQGLASEGAVESFISLNSTIKSTDTYIKSNDIILARTKTMEQSLEQIINVASEVLDTIALRNNSASGENVPIDVLTSSFLGSIEDVLNTRFDGRYLFAGTKTDTRPVENLQFSNVNSTTLETTAAYYRGNSAIASINVSQSQELSYGVTANNEAFQKLIGSIHLLIEGDANNDTDIFADALDMANDALEEIVSIQASTNSASQTLLKANEIHISVGALAFENFSDVAFVRTEIAATKMFQLEATIEATYLAFNRLSGLRLSNFIN